MNQIVNNIKFEMHVKNIKKKKKKILSNYQIFKICSHVNFFSES